MGNERFISLQTLCRHYDVEVTFIRSLNDYGLVEIIRIDEEEGIDPDYLGEVEKMMRLHYDLDINMAGIDAIGHLLKRLEEMQNDMRELRNRLNEH